MKDGIDMFKRLRNRILILNMLLSSLILTVAFTAVYLVTSAGIQAENQRKLEEVQGAVVPLFASGSDAVRWTPLSEGESGLSSTTVTAGDGTEVAVITAFTAASFVIEVDSAGTILSTNSSAVALSDAAYSRAVASALQKPSGGILELEGDQWLYAVSPVEGLMVASVDGQTAVHTEPPAPGHQWLHFLDITDSLKTLRDLLASLVLAGIAALVATFLVSRYFANRSIRPLAQSWERQRRFIADASHELKTPLSIITTNSDALLANSERTIASQQEWLDYLRIGTDRMARLIDELLTYARIEDGLAGGVGGMGEASKGSGFHLTPERVDLSAVAAEVTDVLQAAAAARDVRVSAILEPDIVRTLAPGLVDKVFFALVENAIKYANEGGEVGVNLYVEGTSVVFRVVNSGSGISENDLPHIFERFYRADEARGADGGFGLGLSIVKAAVERLDGRIEATSSPDTPSAPGTTTFTVWLQGDTPIDPG